MTSVQAGDVLASTKATEIVNSEKSGATLFNVKTSLKEIAFGSVAGMTAELFEYPFDLAKVRLQAQLLSPSNTSALRFDGPLHCLLQTWKEEGFRGLYRGLPVPIVGSTLQTASVFVTYTFFQDVIRSLSPSSQQYSKTSPLPISQLAFASAGAGFVTRFVLTPVELIKCKMQVQMMNLHPVLPLSTVQGRVPLRSASTILSAVPSPVHASLAGRQSIHALAGISPSTKLPGIIELTRSVINTEGFRGLWLGHSGTIIRETGGCVAWFVSKEWVARQLLARRMKDSQQHGNTHLFAWESGLSGAIAGAVGALVCYPADTVKSAMQTEEDFMKTSGSAKGPRHWSTFSGTFRRMWATHGLKGLYAGCGMTTARAVPSSGIIFVVYDKLSTWFA